MNTVLTLVEKHQLLRKNQLELIRLKEESPADFAGDETKLYRKSLYRHNDVLYFIAKTPEGKHLYLVSGKPLDTAFELTKFQSGSISLGRGELSSRNAEALWAVFPFTRPVSLRDRRTTIGFGDRLGRATPGHIRAIRNYNASPVFAQQSIRELTLTGRTFRGVVADATFLVFQEGYEKGYGADGDHLKTLKDIDTAIDAGMPMITLDLSEVMKPAFASQTAAEVDAAFGRLAPGVQNSILSEYAGVRFEEGSHVIEIPELEAKRCALMYLEALDFAAVVDRRLRERRGDQYDLEISIDETTAPTLPSHHLFIIRELLKRSVHVNSLAPRFIGEFQKGIDYIGTVQDFEIQFVVHCAIARHHGNYKISIHSGSDKFTVYPVIGKYTGKRLHLKTAGTSWLEAVRTIARTNPGLYRRMHRKAFSYLPEALKLYHITADFSKIRALEIVPDTELETYLLDNNSRQLLHITYGGLLSDPDIRPEFFRTLEAEEELHYSIVAAHLEKHIRLLGIEQEKPEDQPNAAVP